MQVECWKASPFCYQLTMFPTDVHDDDVAAHSSPDAFGDVSLRGQRFSAPDRTTVHENRRHHVRLQFHFMAPRGRQLLLGLKVAHSQEDQTAFFDARKAHAPETDPRKAARVAVLIGPYLCHRTPRRPGRSRLNGHS